MKSEGERSFTTMKRWLAQASAPIHTYFGDDPFYDTRGDARDDSGGRWDVTPYQTADCQHDEQRLAALIAEHCELGDVHSVEIVEATP